MSDMPDPGPGERARQFVDPEGPDPEGVPDLMPESLQTDQPAPEDIAGVDPDDGGAPTG